MLIRFSFITLFLYFPGALFASEVVCNPVPIELAEVNYFPSDDIEVTTVEVIVPGKYKSLNFLSFKMKVEPKGSKLDQFGLEVNLEASHSGDAVISDFELSNYKNSIIHLKALYGGICVSHLDIILEPNIIK